MPRKIAPAMAVFQRARRPRGLSATARAGSESDRAVIRSAEPTACPAASVGLSSGWLIDTPLFGPGAHELLISVTLPAASRLARYTRHSRPAASRKRCVIVDPAYADRPPVRHRHPPHAGHARRDGGRRGW